MDGVIVAGAAAWIAGRWVATAADLGLPPVATSVRAAVDVSAFAATPRIARADRLTRLVAMVAGRALLAPPDPSSIESRSVIVASTLASSHTNEAFERRRMSTGRPVPRDFPYTAPNAAAGELAAALQARGPTLALVGGMDVGLAAIERACRWTRDGNCDRAIVVVAECPPDHASVVAPAGVEPIECAAAFVLQRGHADSRVHPAISARWSAASDTVPARWEPMLSVAPIARLVAAWHERVSAEVVCAQQTGAVLRAAIEW